MFDKKEIISFYDYEIDREEIQRVLDEDKNRLLQESRVVKYIKRNQYLEAYMKYMENIAEPLVRAARLLYTPKQYGYGLCHISHHLPAETVRELEPFYQVASLEEIEENLPKAAGMFAEYERRVREKYRLT